LKVERDLFGVDIVMWRVAKTEML